MYNKRLKSDYEIAKELDKLPTSTSVSKQEVISNMVCSCGRKIGKDDIYFIMIESGEMPELYCEMCVSMNI